MLAALSKHVLKASTSNAAVCSPKAVSMAGRIRVSIVCRGWSERNKKPAAKSAGFLLNQLDLVKITRGFV
jgi:hypothetical protein